MLRLDSTLRKLEIVLSGAVATTQPTFTASWSDGSSANYLGGSTVGSANGVTAVTVVAAPAAGVVRDVDYLSVNNVDTAAVTLTIRYNNNATLITMVNVVLAVGSQLTYVHGTGWSVMDSSGSIKAGVAGPTGGTGPTGAQGAVGPALFFLHDDGEDGAPGVPGPPGVSASRAPGPAFRAWLSSSVTLSSAVNTKVPLQSETFDTAGAFDPTTNYRFQPSVAGYYSLTGLVSFFTSTYLIGVYIYKNGVVYSSAMSLVTDRANVTDVMYLNGTTDYAELYAYTATSQDIRGLSQLTYFSGFLARAA